MLHIFRISLLMQSRLDSLLNDSDFPEGNSGAEDPLARRVPLISCIAIFPARIETHWEWRLHGDIQQLACCKTWIKNSVHARDL